MILFWSITLFCVRFDDEEGEIGVFFHCRQPMRVVGIDLFGCSDVFKIMVLVVGMATETLVDGISTM